MFWLTNLTYCQWPGILHERLSKREVRYTVNLVWELSLNCSVAFCPMVFTQVEFIYIETVLFIISHRVYQLRKVREPWLSLESFNCFQCFFFGFVDTNNLNVFAFICATMQMLK